MIIVAEYIWLKIANWMKMETKKFKLVIRMGIGMKKIGGIIRRNGSHMMIIRGKKKRSIGNKVMKFYEKEQPESKKKTEFESMLARFAVASKKTLEAVDAILRNQQASIHNIKQKVSDDMIFSVDIFDTFIESKMKEWKEDNLEGYMALKRMDLFPNTTSKDLKVFWKKAIMKNFKLILKNFHGVDKYLPRRGHRKNHD